MRSYKLSKTSAMFITFLLSAAVHELVMVIVTQKIRFVGDFVWQLIRMTNVERCVSQDVLVHGAGRR